jgi:RND family efflux transporter MFP subunit
VAASRSSQITRQVFLSILGLVLVWGLWSLLARNSRASNTPSPDSAAQPKDRLSLSEAARAAARVEVEPVRLQSTDGVLNATGTISVPADHTMKVSPTLQGRVRQVLVNIGDMVRAGQTLAILDSVDAANAVNTARQAENKLQLAQENLARQERLYKLGTPEVTAADATLKQAKQQQEYATLALSQAEEQARIGGFTDKPLEDAQNSVVTARTSLTQAQADYAQAEKELGRTKSLKEIGLATDRDLVAQQNAYDKAKVAVEGADESLHLAKEALERERKAHSSGLYANQPLAAARTQKLQAELAVGAAEKALSLAKAQILKDLLQAQNDLRSAQLDLDNARRVLALHRVNGDSNTLPVLAPIGGRITERNVNPNQVIDTTQQTPWQMFTIVNDDRLWVDADVFDKDLSKVRLGDPVTIRVASLPGRQFSGRVTYLLPSADPNSHTFKVRSEIANPERLLKSGMFADISIGTGRGPASLLVPVSAVQVDGDQDFVLVEVAHRQYRKRTVHVGAEKEGFYIVRDGLRPGERVVTHGAIFLAAELQQQ